MIYMLSAILNRRAYAASRPHGARCFYRFDLTAHPGAPDSRGVRGRARNQLWRQILADVFEIELVTVNTTDGVAFGAALLVGVGAGAWSDVPSAFRAAILITGQTKPQGISYERFYLNYCQLYPALQSLFPMLNEKTVVDRLRIHLSEARLPLVINSLGCEINHHEILEQVHLTQPGAEADVV